ncbi:hypothetical protein JKF63_00144 [Porcisia hertigi]|uniref:B box-type domain-containing protein n=1 Tax=Porcisia hertigi TaxID=2761500 RepID=A0A836L0T8_9TRYP|nr:hypothetical protein JKF63_00144 [Porcisia hertigi]
MAKRTPGTAATAGGDRGTATTVPESRIGCPPQIEETFVGGLPATSVPLGEVVTSATEATAQEELTSPLSWPFLCPLCSAVRLTDPVYLHAPTADIMPPSSAPTEAADEGLYCLACRCCAEHWLAAVRAVGEDKAAGLDTVRETSGSPTTPLATSRGSGSASSRATVHACPLCGITCDATLSSTFNPVSGVARVLDTGVVRNSYTGSRRLPSPTTSGSTRVPLSAPAASASPMCSVCDEAKATCACIQCDFGMCDACHTATHTKGGFRQHEVVTVEQASQRCHLKCPRHAGMALDLFCDTCSTCVCVTCCFGGAHRGHEVFPLADVAARTAETLTQLSAELATLQGDAGATRTELTSLWPAYESRVVRVRTEIQQCFASLRQILQDREDGLLDRLKEVSAEVRSRTTDLTTAMDATSSLLSGTGESLRRLPESVSAATLMRIFDTVQQQQEWVSRVSARVIEEAAAAVEGWNYHVRDEGEHGCGMVSFVLLNSDTANDEGLRQYKEVLADLGRLDASADLKLPFAERESSVFLETAIGYGDREEGNVNDHRWGGIAQDCPVSPKDCPTKKISADLFDVKDAGLGSRAIVEESEETLLVRPSHIAAVAVPLSPQAELLKSKEVTVGNGDLEGSASWQRSRSNSTKQSMSRPPQVSPGHVHNPFAHRPLQMYGLNLEPPMRETSSATTPSAPVLASAEAVGLNGLASMWSNVRHELREVSDRGNLAGDPGAPQRSRLVCAAGAPRCVRDTLPFCVSLPPRRAESRGCRDEDGRSTRDDDAQPPWRALKLHLSASAPDRVRSATTSLPRHGSTARSSSLSAPKQGQGVPQRWTTGLQLEL